MARPPGLPTSICPDCIISFVAFLYAAVRAEVTVPLLQAGTLRARGLRHWQARSREQLGGNWAYSTVAMVGKGSRPNPLAWPGVTLCPPSGSQQGYTEDPLTEVMESCPAVCCQDPRAELVDRVAAIDVAHLEEADESTEPARNGVDPPPRARAASVIPGSASRPTPVRPSLSARKFSLQERPAGSCLEAQAGPYSTGPASHISPRAWRRPTIESHRVAISDTEVGVLWGLSGKPGVCPTLCATYLAFFGLHTFTAEELST